MIRICGVELKGSEAVLAIVDADDGTTFVDIEPRKVKLGNDESTAAVKSFFDSFRNFIRDNNVERIVIKKRAKKGKMAGGAISFKMEALIQLNGIADVDYVSGQGIAAEQKKAPFVMPDGIYRYQEVALQAALLYIRKN